MAVTIKDIAKVANVSHTTVSRALRDHPAIAPRTAERIRQIAEDLGYIPNTAARGLKTSRSGILGVIVRRIVDPFFSEVLQGIEDVLQAHSYSLFLAASHRDPDRERVIIQAMSERRVDGVIICSTQVSQQQQRRLAAFNVPTVLINNQAPEDVTHSIYLDAVSGSREVTEYLVGLGHRRIGYLGNLRGGRTNIDRLRGYRQALNTAGIRQRPDYLQEASSGLAAGGAEAASAFLRLSEPPTAIVCYNDVMAIGALQVLQSAGVKVPEQCAVTGFDNIELSAYVTPPLTTFSQPKYELGREAALMMLRLLESSDGDAGDDVRTLRGTLIIRSSTAPPPDN